MPESESKKRPKAQRDILPDGLWTVADFAQWLGSDPAKTYARLREAGVPILTLGREYRHRLVRIEHIVKSKGDYELKQG